jgi:TPR repeat protein
MVTPAAATNAVPRPPTPSAASTPPAMAPEVVAVLITRGDELLSTGDVTAARLMYSRAAAAASADGAAAMGMTFDPTILPRFGVQGLQADRQQATIWYQRAADLGSAEARQLLKQLRDAAAE